MSGNETAGILLCCMGNICRSPTAHGVLQARVKAAGLDEVIRVDSAGTHGFHIGKSPDPRSVEAALERGYDIRGLRARQVTALDLAEFDYVLAMDRMNLEYLQRLAGAPQETTAEVALFLDYHPEMRGREVPDPYYGTVNGFEEVLDLVEAGADALLESVCRRYGL